MPPDIRSDIGNDNYFKWLVSHCGRSGKKNTHTQSNETKYLRSFLTNLDLVNDTALNIPPHCLNVSQLLVVCVRKTKIWTNQKVTTTTPWVSWRGKQKPAAQFFFVFLNCFEIFAWSSSSIQCRVWKQEPDAVDNTTVLPLMTAKEWGARLSVLSVS